MLKCKKLLPKSKNKMSRAFRRSVIKILSIALSSTVVLACKPALADTTTVLLPSTEDSFYISEDIEQIQQAMLLMVEIDENLDRLSLREIERKITEALFQPNSLANFNQNIASDMRQIKNLRYLFRQMIASDDLYYTFTYEGEISAENIINDSYARVAAALLDVEQKIKELEGKLSLYGSDISPDIRYFLFRSIRESVDEYYTAGSEVSKSIRSTMLVLLSNSELRDFYLANHPPNAIYGFLEDLDGKIAPIDSFAVQSLSVNIDPVNIELSSDGVSWQTAEIPNRRAVVIDCRRYNKICITTSGNSVVPEYSTNCQNRYGVYWNSTLQQWDIITLSEE